MKITGRIWKFPQDDVNTDQIRRKIYAYLPLQEQAAHCLEGLDPGFAAKVQRGDILAVGRNFGCGSSSPAHSALIELGIAAIVAESFGRLFFRSCISAGLLVMPCPGILELVNNGDRAVLDAATGRVENVTAGTTLASEPLPDFLRDMIAVGGERPYIKARLAARANG